MRGDRRGERLLVGAPGRVLVAEAPRAIEIDGHRGEALAEARRLEHEAAVLRDEAAAVEDEAVVGADEVRVGDGALVVAGARRDHLAPRARRRRAGYGDAERLTTTSAPA